MAQAAWPLVERRFGQTRRRDAWWVQPLVTFLGLSAFVVYSTWAAFQGNHYEFGPYLSPFYSPLLFGEGAHSWFGPQPGWWPGALPFSAALLILWAPGGFRFTCYYYRGAYYKAFWADPPSCTVGEPRKRYLGERSFPLDPPERPSLLSLPGAHLHRHPRVRRVEGDVVRRRRRRSRRSASASARWCWRSTSSFSAATPSVVTRCGTWSAAAGTRSRSRPSARPVTRARAASTGGTCCLRG